MTDSEIQVPALTTVQIAQFVERITEMGRELTDSLESAKLSVSYGNQISASRDLETAVQVAEAIAPILTVAMDVIERLHLENLRVRDELIRVSDQLTMLREYWQQKVDRAYWDGYSDSSGLPEQFEFNDESLIDPLEREPSFGRTEAEQAAWLAWHDALSNTDRDRYAAKMDEQTRTDYYKWRTQRENEEQHEIEQTQ